MGYQANHDAKQAYSALRKRGIDLRITAEYTPSVPALWPGNLCFGARKQ